MKKELSKELKLIPHGMSPKMNLVFMISFVILGIVFELLNYKMSVEDVSVTMGFNLGGVFLFCAAMFPGQMLISLDIAALVQTSPYKRRLQTSMLTEITLMGNLIAMTLIIVLRGIACAVTNTSFEKGFASLCMTGVIGFFIMAFSSVMYKHFIASLLMLYVLMIAASGGYGYLSFCISRGIMNFSIHPIWVVILCYVLILLGALLENIVAKLFYKHDISKLAFGAAMKRCV